MATIIPSLASANLLMIANELDRLGAATRLHIDIEDGNSIPNITFGISTLKQIADYSDALLDVHLLVIDPYPYIEACAARGVRALSAHYEALPYPMDFCQKVRDAGMQCGIALNCKTPAGSLIPFVSFIDYCLIMTAEPDGRRQRFMPPMLEKIEQARSIMPTKSGVWADGEIGVQELRQVVGAGADAVIVGRAIWGAADPSARYRDLCHSVEKVAEHAESRF